MNVIEMISHCNQNGIPGAILSIDQAKACDSVSHKYMHQVYKFFGLGPNFIKLLETLGNGRTACIAFDDGTYSADFDLKGPKHEIFESGFFTQIRGLWLGDLGTGEKN